MPPAGRKPGEMECVYEKYCQKPALPSAGGRRGGHRPGTVGRRRFLRVPGHAGGPDHQGAAGLRHQLLRAPDHHWLYRPVHHPAEAERVPDAAAGPGSGLRLVGAGRPAVAFVA